MIQVTRGISDARLDILSLQIGIIGEDFLLCRTTCQHVEYVFDANAHTAHAGASTALIRVNGDSSRISHKSKFTSLERTFAVISLAANFANSAN